MAEALLTSTNSPVSGPTRLAACCWLLFLNDHQRTDVCAPAFPACLPARYLDAEEMMSALQELGMLEGMRPKQLGEGGVETHCVAAAVHLLQLLLCMWPPYCGTGTQTPHITAAATALDAHGTAEVRVADPILS